MRRIATVVLVWVICFALLSVAHFLYAELQQWFVICGFPASGAEFMAGALIGWVVVIAFCYGIGLTISALEGR